ncbi:DNA-binding transcriptional ArsR family regulator [Kibdelosporangium banguiense]|uniref:DNA-binding transcriptional ArsR family regulator n=1 Tax=Kibdelosporangium banguiense TaxID=1365924 RepID=A0ABS4T6L4_9PSEU|nr:winged helix-turn-helix domain-containing protein [Kibdelosporangium banguiense]MBP2320054.1 DNA-binding transcriptional ArsR family regulator [Kibdelosporangium banguiense]
MTELVNALMMLQRRDNPLYGPWRRTVWSRFPNEARPLLDLVLPDTAPDYLDSLSPSFDEGLDEVMSADHALQWSAFGAVTREPTLLATRLADGDREARDVLATSVTAAHQAIFGPLWSRVAATHHDDLATRLPTLLTEGIGTALADLFPDAAWNGLVLEIPGRSGRDVKLDGYGIMLAPSTFWTGPPLVGRGVPGQPLLIVYQARIPLPLIDAPDEPGRKLGPLLGRTRAAVLEAIVLNPAVTTSALAHRLGISPGRAHEHAAVLREAGLITSHRHRNTVLHMATTLGTELNPF